MHHTTDPAKTYRRPSDLMQRYRSFLSKVLRKKPVFSENQRCMPRLISRFDNLLHCGPCHDAPAIREIVAFPDTGSFSCNNHIIQTGRATKCFPMGKTTRPRCWRWLSEPCWNCLPPEDSWKISAVVGAAVKTNNTLPLILGEHWFCASQAKPHLPSTKTIIQCYKEPMQQIANAVVLTTAALSPFYATDVKAGTLKLTHGLNENEPLWSKLAKVAVSKVHPASTVRSAAANPTTR